MIKLSIASKQCLKLLANPSLAMPNSDSAVFFTVRFDGVTGGDVEQILLSTTESKQAGGFNVHYRTNGSWLAADVRGKIRVWIEGVTDAAGATVNLLSKDSFSSGTYQFAIRRTGTKLQLVSCVVNGQPNNPVAVQSEVAINVGFTHPQGIMIGNRSIMPPNTFADQSISRVGQVNTALSDAEIAKMAYGVSITQLGKTPAWYASLQDLNNLNGFSSVNSPAASAEPAYGYKPDAYGTFEKPFAATSLWNSKPVNPVLGTFVIPPCYRVGAPKTQQNKYYIDVTAGDFSSGVFRTDPSDGPMTIYKQDGKAGIHDKDADEYLPSITLPHWPEAAFGAEGSDGHCDIIDVENKIIHSFWILKKNSLGQFTARQYTWAALDGTGWGDGAHYYTGARATGVPSCAGMIRKDEINDGKPMYEHALGCALDYTALASNPAYCSPATSSDHDPQSNSGVIPQGALMMLPANYDTSRLNRWPNAKKIAETLKVYGVRVTDRNDNCPMTIYVEKNAGWSLHPSSGWDQNLANEMEYIREQLRHVVSVEGYTNGLGQPYKPLERQNLLSMRGPWYIPSGSNPVVKGLFNSVKQRLELPAAGGKWKNATSGFKLAEFKPVAGKYYKLYSESDCGASFRFTLYNYPVTGGVEIKDTPALGNYQSLYIKWPRGAWYYVEAYKNATPKPGYLQWRFIEISEAEYLANTPKFSF